MLLYNRVPASFNQSNSKLRSVNPVWCFKLFKTNSNFLATMSDTDNRVIFPDEVEDIKETAKAEVNVEAGNSNSVEETPANPSVTMRNMITVPGNCPPGYKMGVDGVCREVFD